MKHKSGIKTIKLEGTIRLLFEVNSSYLKSFGMEFKLHSDKPVLLVNAGTGPILDEAFEAHVEAHLGTPAAQRITKQVLREYARNALAEAILWEDDEEEA